MNAQKIIAGAADDDHRRNRPKQNDRHFPLPPFHAKNNETASRMVPFSDREKVAMAGAAANISRLGIRAEGEPDD
jgi:hypothetical protein